MARAGYDWGFTDGVCWIIDQDNGRMSVTNDIENVVNECIGKMKGDSYHDRISENDLFIYRDSEGDWTQYHPKNGNFTHLKAKTRHEASQLVKQKSLPL